MAQKSRDCDSCRAPFGGASFAEYSRGKAERGVGGPKEM